MNASEQKIMVVAGGTGGHVFPALALVHELIQQEVPVSFITDQRGVRYLKDLPSVVPLKVIPLGSITTGIGGRLLFLWQMIASIVIAFFFIIRQGSHKIIGYGGYPTIPGILAGILLGKTLYASEHDAVLGSTNRRFARFCQRIFLATPLLKPLMPPLANKCTLVGMPVRVPIEALNNRLYQPPQKNGAINLTVLGGSQGATIFNEVVPQALSQLPAPIRKRLCVVQQIRDVDCHRVREFYHHVGIQAHISPFFDDVDQILLQTHFIICRSGASTVAEVIAAGVPALFVPYPYAAHDHQTANASLLVNQGAGWMIAQSDFTAKRCGFFVQNILTHNQQLLFATERLKLFSQKNVTQTLASHILSV
jgi:UDP-N-acetylglucosamine--N-acetylmuramyl-(pentapeptide) pyrophosphoryl-undecaprenol N-acetylglucosamine transferase